MPMLVNDRVRDAHTNAVGTIIDIDDGWYTVEDNDGEKHLYREHELYPDVDISEV